MDSSDLLSAVSDAECLRAFLHTIPESSMHETKTKDALMTFLRSHGLDITDRGVWFYASHRESKAVLPSIAFRADMDAVASGGACAAHLCGHDGHSAALAAFAASTAGKTFGRDIFFLFQPAEETGEGAPLCREIFSLEHIDEIYAFHNIPGYEAGRILLRRDVFACASVGLTLRLTGVRSHAAYPENGRNPALAVGELLCAVPEMSAMRDYRGMTLITPVCIRAGEKAFGVSAGDAEVCFTIRAHYSADLEKLRDKIIHRAGELCGKHGLTFSFSMQDPFPSTENSPHLFEKVRGILEKNGFSYTELPEPMRWSEDFGWYGQDADAFFFGIGGGEGAAGLHTPEYSWNAQVTETAVKVFCAIASA